MSAEKVVDGALGLSEQNRAIEFFLQQHRSKLLSYRKDTVQMQNLATFEELPLGTDIPKLTLIAVPAGSGPAAVQPAATTLVFDENVFVEGEVKRVAGFHSA